MRPSSFNSLNDSGWSRWRLKLIGLAVSGLLAGCAGLGAPATRDSAGASAPSPAPARWRAPLPEEAAWPHEGRLDHLLQWWRQQSDPVVVGFIEAAQAASPSIAGARSRLQQAQAERVAIGAALFPQVDGALSAQRRSATPPFPAGSQGQLGLQAAWELDLFGALRSQREASQWRLQAADAAWHDARISVAADAALQVINWRHCRAMVEGLQADAQAATRSAAHLRNLAQAGLQPEAQAAQAEAAAADSRNRARAQTQRCEAEVKALVALTALGEDAVREALAGGSGTLQWASPRMPLQMPAATLAQRPDVFAAAAAVAAAAADVGAQDAQRYPRVGLSGTLGRLNTRSDTFTATLNTWTVGPLSVSVPVFDAGRRQALSEAARARHAQAVAEHQAVVRQAVREVEEALLALQTTAAQLADAQQALDRSRRALQAARDLQRQGLASGLELEEALRRSLTAEFAWLDLQRNRSVAWVNLYRAAGGGWTAGSGSGSGPGPRPGA